MYKIAINLPSVGEGVDVEVDGLGVFPNGSAVVVDDDLADSFERRHGVTMAAARFQEGIEVTTVEKPKPVTPPQTPSNNDAQKGGDK